MVDLMAALKDVMMAESLVNQTVQMKAVPRVAWMDMSSDYYLADYSADR